MANPDLILIPFAQDGDKNTIPLELGIGDPVYRASLKVGFPPDTRIPKDIGGEPPDGLDFNGILNVLSQAIVFMQKGNAYQFDASLAPYPIGALVRSNDDLTTFQNTEPLNSNNPNSNMTGWRVYNGSGFIVDNLTTNDSAKALSAAQGKALQDNKLEANKVASANGVASLDANTKVPVAQLPNASTTAIGAVQLNNTLTSVSTGQALTAAQGKAIADAFTGAKSINGYQKLYGGLIIQWGTTGSLNYDTSLNISFPILFPSACLNMVASPRAINTQSFSGSVSAYTSNVTNTGATLTNDSSTAREAFAITWMAIGY